MTGKDESKIGTTNLGIGPTYSSKCFRNGVRVADLMGDTEAFEDRHRRLASNYRNQFLNIQVDEYAKLAKFEVIGVVKAYQTRMGTGPLPNGLFDDDGAKLQSIGHEVGVTTRRERRCGWLELFLLLHSVHINGYTRIALTKMDILDSFPELKVAVGCKMDGVQLASLPSQA